MGYGGHHPYPRRFGGGKPHLQVIHEALNAQRGTAFDPVALSVVSLENMAIARAICFDGWGTNQRLAQQWDPRRTTDMLPRWEKIFGIRPDPSASFADRREELTLRWQRFGALATHARIETELRERLGEYFVQVEYLSLGVASVYVPGAGYPWGTQLAGVWSSTVAHILVLTQKPEGASEGQFYDAVAQVYPILDAIVPAWVTFDWYRTPVGVYGTPVDVPGGPSQAGFYLDQDHNLDNHVLDV